MNRVPAWPPGGVEQLAAPLQQHGLDALCVENRDRAVAADRRHRR